MITGGGHWDLINLNGQNLVFRSIQRGFVSIPKESWSYRNGNTGQWNDDDNIKITGRFLQILYYFEIFILEAPKYPLSVEIQYLNKKNHTFLNGF